MEKRSKIKKIIRKFKYVTYITIGIIGILMIVFANGFFSENQGNMTYDILIGVGCSVVATAVVTMILLLVLPDESEENVELRTWGIVRIYEERRNAAFTPNKIPNDKLDYIAFGLKHFRVANSNINQLLKKIKSGLHVRILTLHPKSEYINKYQRFENTGGLRAEIEDLIKWVEVIQNRIGPKAKGSIELRLYDNLPLDFYCRADSTIWIGPYLPGVISSSVITYEFLLDSKGGKQFEQLFQDYWDGKNGVNIVSKDKLMFLGNQKESIESVLKYFCDEMSKDDGGVVIGVVVLFKKDKQLRRTMFSCNKLNKERHNCYNMGEGAVGKMLELNKSSKKALFFRDYTNDISIESSKLGRNEDVHKIEVSIEPFKKDSDMSAILAAPIYIENEMIGAVTFDFNELSNKYRSKIMGLKNMNVDEPIDNDNILYQWFHMAESCTQIVSHMLGDEIDIYYKELYEEEWKCNES